MVTVGCGCFVGVGDLHWAFGKRWFEKLPRPRKTPSLPENGPEPVKNLLPCAMAEEANSEVQTAATKSSHTVAEAELSPSSESFVALCKAFPDAPKNELERFAVGWSKVPAALAAYEEHLKWRAASDPEDLAGARNAVPEWISQGPLVGTDGSPVILLQVARTDCHHPPELYFKALCCSINEQMGSDENFQRVTVLLDVRAGATWPNPKPHELLPLLRLCARQLPLHYPGVLHRIILYPVPVAAALFTRMALAFVDSVTRSRICLISERSKGGFEKHLEEYISKESLPAYAWSRHPNLK